MFTGQCEEFEHQPNTQYLGGVGSPSSTSLEECKQACRSNPACLALDFNPVGAPATRCFLHLNAAFLIPTNMFTGNYVDHYIFTKCAIGESLKLVKHLLGCVL